MSHSCHGRRVPLSLFRCTLACPDQNLGSVGTGTVCRLCMGGHEEVEHARTRWILSVFAISNAGPSPASTAECLAIRAAHPIASGEYGIWACV